MTPAQHFWSIHPSDAAQNSWNHVDAWAMMDKIVEKRSTQSTSCVQPHFLRGLRLSLRLVLRGAWADGHFDRSNAEMSKSMHFHSQGHTWIWIWTNQVRNSETWKQRNVTGEWKDAQKARLLMSLLIPCNLSDSHSRA